TDEARIEGRHVPGEHVTRVALGIDRDEEHLHAPGIRAELVLRHLELGERRWTDIGAVRVAEEYDHGLAAEVRQRARLSGVIHEAEVLAVVGTGDVDVLELRPGTAAAGRERGREHGGDRGEQPPAREERNGQRAARRTGPTGRRSRTGTCGARARRCTRDRAGPRTR